MCRTERSRARATARGSSRSRVAPSTPPGAAGHRTRRPPGQPDGSGCRLPAPGRPSGAGPRSRRSRPRRRSGGRSRPGGTQARSRPPAMTTSRSVIRSAEATEMAFPSAECPSTVVVTCLPSASPRTRAKVRTMATRTAPRGGRGPRRHAAIRGTRRARPSGTLAGRRRRSRGRSSPWTRSSR